MKAPVPLLLLPLLSTVTITSWSPIPAAAAAGAEAKCNAAKIRSDNLLWARGKVVDDMISGTYSHKGLRYCTWATVAGQTMYGKASCEPTMLCDYKPGQLIGCPTTADECATCLYSARDSINHDCGQAIGAHLETSTDRLWCYMQYEKYQLHC